MMKQFYSLTLLIILAGNTAVAQEHTGVITADTTYYKATKSGMHEVPPQRAETFVVQFFKDDQIFEKKIFEAKGPRLIQHSFYKNGKPSGKWQYFNDAGELTHVRDFSKLTYGPCNKPDSIAKVEIQMPEFKGGINGLMRYLGKHITFPDESKDTGTVGIVYMKFIVDSRGRVIPSYICGSGLDPFCDLEVWEVVAGMPAWIPGKKDGKNIDMSYTLPVRFKMQ